MGLKLNVGCGPTRNEGELGVDLHPTEARDVAGDALALPFPDGSAEFIRLDHILEHLPCRKVATALWEAFRVLAPAGTIRVGIPDMAALCRAYAEIEGLATKARALRYIYGGQHHEGEYHLSGWDADTMADQLGAVGFVDVECMEDTERGQELCIKVTGRKPREGE